MDATHAEINETGAGATQAGCVSSIKSEVKIINWISQSETPAESPRRWVGEEVFFASLFISQPRHAGWEGGSMALCLSAG